eukprot:TRINITY_DN3507_c0_g2_i12.p1 TRINITY_DN3507_c0_g2~~TRINITY_DN3507_c0_g2_i12.p1  ORF type:complete len:268 (+),score=72.85 TRINITY_DN3507_c0_g2_i12:388-1191(+)
MPYPRPPDVPLYGFKLPTVLEIQPLVFEPNLYDGNDMKPQFEKDDTGKPFLKKTVGDVMRWRYVMTENGLTRESNSRFVTWSDGSMHLFVGNSCYAVEPVSLMDHRDIFVRQRVSETSEAFLQYHGTLSKKLNLIPADLNRLTKIKSAIQMPSLKRSRFTSRTLADLEKDKIAKENMEQNMLELRSNFSVINQPKSKQVLSAAFLENENYDPEKEREKRIVAAKKGKRKPKDNFVVSDDEELSYEDDEEEEEEELSDEEPSHKKSRY